jgi:pumilio family protein 6
MVGFPDWSSSAWFDPRKSSDKSVKKSSWFALRRSAHYETMPTAVTTKNPMNGTKRKAAPSKDAGMKGTKKPKIDSSIKSTMKKTKVQPKPKKIEELSDSEDPDSDGGAPLHKKPSADSEDLEESDTTDDDGEKEASRAVSDGLHPDRVKAQQANSKNL